MHIDENMFCCWCLSFFIPGNYYGTPKPSAEPSPVQPDLVDQVLFDEEFDMEVQRKRTTSVSKMDRKDSAAPEEEEEDERSPIVNGLAGERHCFYSSTAFFSFHLWFCCFVQHFIIFFSKCKTVGLFFFPLYHPSLQTFSGLAFLHARSALNHSPAKSSSSQSLPGINRSNP